VGFIPFVLEAAALLTASPATPITLGIDWATGLGEKINPENY
jgi:hypothetical protein